MRPGSKPPNSKLSTCSADGSTAPEACSSSAQAPRRQRSAASTVLPVAHQETRVELLPARGRERSVDAVGEEARRSVSFGRISTIVCPLTGLPPSMAKGAARYSSGSGRHPTASRWRRPCSRGRYKPSPGCACGPTGELGGALFIIGERRRPRFKAVQRCSGRSPVWHPPAARGIDRRRTRPKPNARLRGACFRSQIRAFAGWIGSYLPSAPCRPPARMHPPRRSASFPA